jgi:multidrug resistance efflux pump
VAAAFQAPLDRTLRLTGQTSARIYSNITAPIQRGGDRQQMALLSLAKGGSLVKKGDVVVEMDPQMGRDRLDDFYDGVRTADRELDKRRAEQAVEWQSLQQTLKVARSTLDKARLDYSAQEVRTQVERELLKLAVEQADARYKQQQKDQDYRRASQKAELRILEIAAIRAKTRVERMENNLSRFVLKAPMDGLVVLQNIFRGGEFTSVQLGDQLASGQPIMKIVDPGSMQVEAIVNQVQSSQLRIGQRVRIGMDAFPDLKLTGRVHSIGALATGGWMQSFYVRNVPVLIAIDGRDPRVIPDMSAYADVTLERVESALQIPRSAVHAEEGTTYVHLKTPQGFVKKTVTLGPENDNSIVVKAGLNVGDEVRIP